MNTIDEVIKRVRNYRSMYGSVVDALNAGYDAEEDAKSLADEIERFREVVKDEHEGIKNIKDRCTRLAEALKEIVGIKYRFGDEEIQKAHRIAVDALREVDNG